MLDHTGFFVGGFIMQPVRIVRIRAHIMVLTIAFVWSLTLTGCGSGKSATAVEQATAGHDAAKSSMDYMKKHRSESSKAVKKVNIKTH